MKTAIWVLAIVAAAVCFGVAPIVSSTAAITSALGAVQELKNEQAR